MDERSQRYPPLVWFSKKKIMKAANAVRKHPDLLKVRLKYGLFCHVRFPSWESISDCTWTSDLVYNLLENDAVGFHTRQSCLNFLAYCKNVLHLETNVTKYVVNYKKRTIATCTVPLGIPYDRYEKVYSANKIMLNLPPFETCMILRADSLTKENVGRMRKRFAAFDEVIKNEPTVRGMIIFLQIILMGQGSADSKGLLEYIESIASEMNSKYSSTKWKPIHVVQGFPSQTELAPFYEDMKLMSTLGQGDVKEREFILTETKTKPKVYIFSPYFGVADQMREANIREGEIKEMTDKILKKMSMSETEQVNDLKTYETGNASFMKEYMIRIAIFTADCIVAEDMEDFHQMTFEYLNKHISKLIVDPLPTTLVLDYGGTLVPLARGEEEVCKLDLETRNLLANLSVNPKFNIIIVSTRNVSELYDLVNIDKVSYIGSRGFYILYSDGARWEVPSTTDNFGRVVNLVEDLHFEVCKHGAYAVNQGSVVWYHFRKVPIVYRKPLYTRAMEICAKQGFRIFRTNRALEARLPIEGSKGEACVNVLEHIYGTLWMNKTHIIYVGDDKYDEQAMMLLNSKVGITTFRVLNGTFPKTDADFKLSNHQCVKTLLKWFVSLQEQI